STLDVLSRLDSMILMSGIELPVRAIREMVASAVDIIVHTARLSDGSRKVLAIAEVAGMKDELHINLNEIFIFKQTGVNAQGKVQGYFTATGYKPTFMDEIRVRGVAISDEIFKPARP
ncbi:MAG: CpaF family protein, partial [Candidatus Omnitrophota bacterium]